MRERRRRRLGSWLGSETEGGSVREGEAEIAEHDASGEEGDGAADVNVPSGASSCSLAFRQRLNFLPCARFSRSQLS